MYVSGVAQCDSHVAQITASLGAFDRTPLEALIKFLGCEQQFLGQRMRRALILKRRIALTCKSIPRADSLTDVTSENPISNLVTQFDRNILLEFDGEIRDATAGVDGAVWKDAICGAGFDTAR